jgi:Flp pilus assembly protein TadG
MIVRSSDRRPWAGLLRDERGTVLGLVALCLVVIMGSVGLGLDLGRAYLQKVRLGRAVDAGALAAARALRDGEEVARREALRVAAANGVANGVGGITTSLIFGTNARGEATVSFTARQTVPTTFTLIMGIGALDVTARAVAAVPPVDVVLILDTSGSLASAGAFDELQQAAHDFVDNFDDHLDQMGLVSFQISAHDRFVLRDNFKIDVHNAINTMASAGDTNIGEGIRKARLQLMSASARANAAKIVVFFTDGRATAYRGTFGGADRMLAVYTTGTTVRGYFNNPDGLAPYASASANGCKDVGSCFSLSGSQIRANAATYGTQQANLTRQEDILIYSIGLGNPAATDPLLVPDMNYLRAVANENGVSSSTQPKGKAYFAPSAAQLQAVFNEVSRDLIVRLAG